MILRCSKAFRAAARVSTLILALSCLGEQVPPTSTNGQELVSSEVRPVFRLGTNLVQVPVVVRDNSGHTVGNLHADDFRLSDNGRPQVISRFAVEQMRTNENIRVRAERPEAGGPASGNSSLPDRFVGYLVDDVTLSIRDLIVGRQSVVKHLEALRPSDRTAVYSASGGVATDFSDDRSSLRKALEKINPLTSPLEECSAAPAGGVPILTYYKALLITGGDTGALQDCIGAGNGFNGIAASHARLLAESVLQGYSRYARGYLHALEKMIDKMAPMPGDRLIVLISPGVYLAPEYQAMKEEILAKAIRAKIVISGFDPRGVYLPGDPDPTTSVDRYGVDETQGKFAFVGDLASGTGGIYLRGNNDLDLQLRRTTSVPEFIYVLSFSPQQLTFDGKQHQLKVDLRNSRGLTLQARGNYRTPTGSEDPVDQAKQQIEEAFFSAQELKDLPIRIQTQFFRDGDDAILNVISNVDVRNLPFQKQEGRNNDSLAMVVGLFDQNGNYIAAFQKTIAMSLKDENLDAWLKSGVEIRTEFTVKPGKYLVRLVVRDAGSQSMAEQSSGVQIP